MHVNWIFAEEIRASNAPEVKAISSSNKSLFIIKVIVVQMIAVAPPTPFGLERDLNIDSSIWILEVLQTVKLRG